MAAITYTATRNLISGHTADTIYSMDISMADISGGEFKADRSRQLSMSGIPETWLQRIDEVYTFTTIPIDETDTLCDQMKEFLTSVMGGEQFTVDQWGTVASPDNALTVELNVDSVNFQRMKGIRHLVVSFSVRVIA